MDSINSYQCERCVHGIYDQQDDTWNCGAGCIEISECSKEYKDERT